MKRIVAFLMASAALAHGQIMLTWCAPTNGLAPQGYIVLHATADTAEIVGAATTNCPFPNLTPGVHYFSVSDFAFDPNGNLLMAGCTNTVTVTNVAGVVVNQLILNSTNQNGGWAPYFTNHTFFLSSDGSRFFKDGGISIVRTNLILAPSPGQ